MTTYQKLYSNKGTRTKRINNDTADSLREKYIQPLRSGAVPESCEKIRKIEKSRSELNLYF